jgi:hypothetical protein
MKNYQRKDLQAKGNSLKFRMLGDIYIFKKKVRTLDIKNRRYWSSSEDISELRKKGKLSYIDVCLKKPVPGRIGP